MPSPSGPPAGELVDIVDDHDRVIGVLTRAEMRARRVLHRAVFVAVRHPDGRLLVHQRSFDKDLWPGMWDIAVGGVVGSGESYDDAARRELAEEVGMVDAVPVAVDDCIAQAYRDEDVELMARCYEVTTAGPFDFVDREVIHAEWTTLTDLPRMLGERRFIPDSLALLLPLLR